MPKFASSLLVLILAFSAVACGSSDGDGGDGVSLDSAESCEQLMDAFIPVIQGVLDEMSDLSVADFQSDEPPEVLTNLEADSDAFGEKSDELGCGEEEMAPLLAERLGDLTAEGQVAEMVLELLKAGEFN